MYTQGYTDKDSCYRGVQQFEDITTNEVRFICTRVYKNIGQAKAQNTRNKREYYYERWAGVKNPDGSIRNRTENERLIRTDMWVEEATGWTRV